MRQAFTFYFTKLLSRSEEILSAFLRALLKGTSDRLRQCDHVLPWGVNRNCRDSFEVSCCDTAIECERFGSDRQASSALSAPAVSLGGC